MLHVKNKNSAQWNRTHIVYDIYTTLTVMSEVWTGCLLFNTSEHFMSVLPCHTPPNWYYCYRFKCVIYQKLFPSIYMGDSAHNGHLFHNIRLCSTCFTGAYYIWMWHLSLTNLFDVMSNLFFLNSIYFRYFSSNLSWMFRWLLEGGGSEVPAKLRRLYQPNVE